MGMPAPIGTGIFQLLHKPSAIDELKSVPLLFDSVDTNR